jgi:dolichol-phosphate mannosyltransferase
MYEFTPMTDPYISIVVPVYREESNIIPFITRTTEVMLKLGCTYEILFCLDPSPDRTEEVLLDEISKNDNIRLIVFSRRFGQPAATMAGIHLCKGDACVVIDVDLQDQPELIEPMLEEWRKGYKVVYAKRKVRHGETLIKKIITKFGYFVINKISDVSIPANVGDFRLMDRVVIDHLKILHESHGYLRGMVSYVGFKQTFIEYDRDERSSGISNYNRYIGSLKIAFNGIFGFSIKPLQLLTILGSFVALFAFFLGFWSLLQKYMFNVDPTPGLTWTIVLITFFSGVQLFSLGIMGEYVGRIYDEVKQRPMYIIEKTENI